MHRVQSKILLPLLLLIFCMNVGCLLAELQDHFKKISYEDGKLPVEESKA